MKKLFYRTYLGMAIFNTILAVLSLVGVIFYGAKWHIATFLIAAWLAVELYAESRRELQEPEHEPKNDILEKELWNRK
jgi:hypothetical protein